MTRTAPDHGNVKAGTPLHRLDDMAELAARLCSIVTFDRSGRAIYLEDFSHGAAQWATASYGTGAGVAITTDRCESKGFSLEFTTGQDDAKAAKATRQFAYHHLCKMGLEYAFTHTADSVYHHFEFIHHEGSTKYYYAIRFHIQTGQIAVRDGVLGWKEIASGCNLKSDAFTFNRGKLVIDSENNEYVRFIFNDETYDLSEYVPLESTESTIPFLEVSIQFTGDAGSNRVHYVDDVIVTQNEP